MKRRRAVRGGHKANMTSITCRASDHINNYTPDLKSNLVT